MKKTLMLVGMCATLALFCFAKTTTITGTINDAKCGAKMVNADCAKKCVAGGEAAIVVVDKSNKVYKIANQDSIKDHVGDHLSITGDVKGDTITIASVAAAPAAK